MLKLFSSQQCLSVRVHKVLATVEQHGAGEGGLTLAKVISQSGSDKQRKSADFKHTVPKSGPVLS